MEQQLEMLLLRTQSPTALVLGDLGDVRVHTHTNMHMHTRVHTHKKNI